MGRHRFPKSLLKVRFFQVWEARLNTAYGSPGLLGSSTVHHPIDFYQTIANSGRVSSGQGAKAFSKTQAFFITAQSRLFDGPELNFILAGVPMVLAAAIGTISVTIKEKKRAAAPPPAAAHRPIRLALKAVHTPTAGTTPLPMGTCSSAFVPFKSLLVDAGLDEDLADSIIAGEFEGQDLADVLDEEDYEAVGEAVAKLVVTSPPQLVLQATSPPQLVLEATSPPRLISS